MADVVAQASFNSGEWAPNLFARVDIQKYHSAAALLKNWFVDYRGGASTRTGTRYVIQAYQSATAVRLIKFQAAFSVGYELEFGEHYIRFIFNGAPVVETPIAITGATNDNPCVLTIPGNTYTTADWIYVAGVGGMTQLNGRYFSVAHVAGSAVTIADLNGNNINSSAYSAYTSGGTSARIYTIASPYLGSELALLKFTQATGGSMIICHPNHSPFSLSIISATNWVLAPITIGSTAAVPQNCQVASSLPTVNVYTTPPQPGQAWYSYGVTSVDSNNQESAVSNLATVGPLVDIRSYPGANQITWNQVADVKYYKVYENNISYFGVQPPGTQLGYIGYVNAGGDTFIDDNITPDFSLGPPIPQNPFAGSGVAYITVAAHGTYTTVPGVTLSGGSPQSPGSAYALLSVIGTVTITAAGTGYQVGDVVNFGSGLTMAVRTVGAGGAITSWAVNSAGTISSGSTPTNPIAQVYTTGTGTGAQATATWGVGKCLVSSPGSGYTSPPSVTFSSGSASATAFLEPPVNGSPTVPAFFQQRLVLAGAVNAPQSFNMSRPGNYFNFDISQPIQPSDAITETLVSNTANAIKSMISVPAGLLILTDQAAWTVNGGFVSQGVAAAVSPTAIVATQQNFVGANDMPPILANWYVLFVQSKGAQVRELQYNIYFNIFTSNDISVFASHLFYGYQLLEWAYAEQPFYLIPTVRNDGTLLMLTYLKEQDFAGWSHHTTQGSFLSVSSVTEVTQDTGTVDATYVVVSRVVKGQTVKYIERFAERIFPNGLASAWCVDAGIQYIGPSTLAFQGAEHLAGLTVTGLAQDNLGNVTQISPFVMPSTGFFSLLPPASPASGYTLITLGLPFTCDLQTLPLDVQMEGGTVQGKPKKIPYADVRVKDTLGLKIGSSFSTLTPMKDLVQGNVSSMLTGQPVQQVNGLYTGDARTFLDPTYTIPGQYCIRQDNPYPASVLGVFPAITVGDDR